MRTSYREDMTAANPLQTEPDHELLRRVTQGHTDAFTELFRRRRGEVFRFATHMTGSCQAGEDVLQDVFLVVMREAGRYDASRASVSAWLCGIARNCVRQRLTGDRRYQPLAADDEAEGGGPVDRQDSPLDQLVRQERADLVREAIRALPLAYREAVVLCDLQERPYADAASILGCPIGTVRSRVHRGRALLAAALSAERSADTANDEESVPGAQAGAVVSKGCFV